MKQELEHRAYPRECVLEGYVEMVSRLVAQAVDNAWYVSSTLDRICLRWIELYRLGTPIHLQAQPLSTYARAYWNERERVGATCLGELTIVRSVQFTMVHRDVVVTYHLTRSEGGGLRH